MTVSGGHAFGQCTLSGLQSFYCTSDSGSQLTASCTGGSATILGPGVNSSGYFDPSQSGVDSIPILVLEGTTTYTIDQTGTFNPDTSGGGTAVTLSDDAVTGQLQIGFTFRFFDNQYTTFQIASNGFITFGSNTDNGCCTGDYIPSSSTPNNLIAHVWNDLYPPGGGSITYKTIGTAPNRKCIIDFAGTPQCCGTSYPRYSQIHLFEGCGRIEIHTQSQPQNYSSSTQGIENANGTTAYATPGRNSAVWTATNDFVAFQPNCGDTFWTFVSEGPTLSLNVDSNNCFFDSNATATVNASGEAPFTYAWPGGQTSASVSGLPSGTYTVTVTDNDGCANTAEATVFSPDPISVNANVTNAFCEGQANGSITTVTSGGVPPYAYSWSNGGTTGVLTGLLHGTYTVTITDANNCIGTSTAVVDFDNPDPVVDLGPDKNICPDGVTLLSVMPFYSAYAWSTGDSLPNLLVSQGGTYTVTVTSTAGCTRFDEVTVTEVLPVEVDLGPDLSGYGPIAIDAGSQFTQYVWSTGSNQQVINVALSGNYSVTVADTNGCSSSDAIKVTLWPSAVELIEDDGFNVFPNPASDVLSIVSDEAYQHLSITLMDINGKTVYQSTHSVNGGDRTDINVSKLAPGTYTLVMKNGEEQKQRTIVIQ